ncbi:MAG: hypothetical protein IKE59_08505 [Erysipelotrichaceae bacterium]|nr:hypothetical protein [Erysipelotrichaceae bacterium]
MVKTKKAPPEDEVFRCTGNIDPFLDHAHNGCLRLPTEGAPSIPAVSYD